MRRIATLAFGLVASEAPALAQENTILFALGGLACSEVKLSTADILAVLNAAKADDPHVIEGGAPRWSSDHRRRALRSDTQAN